MWPELDQYSLDFSPVMGGVWCIGANVSDLNPSRILQASCFSRNDHSLPGPIHGRRFGDLLGTEWQLLRYLSKNDLFKRCVGYPSQCPGSNPDVFPTALSPHISSENIEPRAPDAAMGDVRMVPLTGCFVQPWPRFDDVSMMKGARYYWCKCISRKTHGCLAPLSNATSSFPYGLLFLWYDQGRKTSKSSVHKPPYRDCLVPMLC